MNKKNKIKKLISFDFDDTLVHTPLPQEGKKIWKEKTGEEWPHRGWWSKPESLDTDIFDIPLNKKIHKRYQQAIKDPDNYVILATGRIEPLKDEVYEILGEYGLSFDETHLNPGIDTFDFKSNLFAKLIYELHPEEFIMYDDRQEHLVRFVAWANDMPCKVTIIDAISGEEFKSEEDKNLQEQITRIKSMMGIINEDITKDPINELNELQKSLEENVLKYYEVRDGKVYDIKANQPIDFSGLGTHLKTKIESILVGAEELGQKSNTENKKNEIINSDNFKTFFGDYNKITIAKNLNTDPFTEIRCEYYRKGHTRDGEKLLGIDKRPWCKI